MDPDYENLAEGEPAQESFLQYVGEPADSTQGHPESLQMDVVEGCTDSWSDGGGHTRDALLDAPQNNALQRHRWSAATMRVLCSMPSRAVGQNSAAGISRQIPPRVTSHPPGATQVELGGSDAEGVGPEGRATGRFALIIRGLPVGEAARKLRAMPLSLAEKRELRRLASSHLARGSPTFGSALCHSRLGVTLSRAWRRCRLGCLPALGSLRPWHSTMKMLGGRFGTGVLSYFLFLRNLLRLNLLLFAVVGLFVVLPQAANPHDVGRLNDTFTVRGLLTGTGFLSQTVMFYGYYSDTSIKMCTAAHSCSTGDSPDLPQYSIAAAYLSAISISFFIICVILVYSMSKSFGRSFHVLGSNGNLALKVFCTWDFKLIKKTSIRLHSEKISTELKELLSETVGGRDETGIVQRLYHLTVHLLAWALCLASIVVVTMAVYHQSEANNEQDDTELLLLSAGVSGINLLLPGLFNLFAWQEKHNSPSVSVYVSILRNLLLKISIVGVLCYRWLGRISQEERDLKCWENFVGQELYRLLLMDFIFTVLNTFMVEFLWRLFSKRVLKRDRKPSFDIARNVLDLIYGQTLTWYGVLFAPLLPAVQIIKLLVLFYMKKSSLMHNCQPCRKPWRARQMTTLFISLLCFPSFLSAAVSVVYTIWTIKPSSSCGPFRNFTTMIESKKLWFQEQENSHLILSQLRWVFKSVVENPPFLFLTTGVFLLIIYFFAQVVDGQRRIISQLEKQIENDGKDKKFLISKLQDICEENILVSPHRYSQ